MKNTIVKITILAAMVLCWGNELYGDTEKATIKELSLDEFIEMSCANDEVFEEILVESLKLNYLKKLKLPADDIILSVKNNYAAFLRSDKGNPEYQFSLAKLFPDTGTNIGAGYLSKAEGPDGWGINGEFYALVSQPVARNAFGRTNRLLDKIVGMEIDIAWYQIVEAYEKYLAAIINIYYDWNEAYENLKTAENSYKENMKILDNVKERERNNIALPVDVNKVLLQVMLKEETMLEAGNSFREYANLLRKSIGYDVQGTLIPGGPDRFEGIEIDFDEEYRVFREKGRTSLILDMLEEKSALEVDKYADALLPSVELFAEYRIKGADRYLEKDDKRVFVGFTMDYPFPGQVENAEYETSKIDHDMRVLNRTNTQIRIYTDLRNIYQEIEKEKKLIKIAAEKIKVSESVVRDDSVNYSYGRVVLNNFIDEVNRLDLNRFSLIQRNIRLKKLIIEWLTLTDRLVREEGKALAIDPKSRS
ncbi:MAG: TolC family protein [Candidatus Omnitrophica bacterium]|nr:TolC family protein [Candidatus Omnitrophota bacterium]MDD4013057.1 TolC family protein [Candidatus Omnitrophota bacterium]